MFSLFFGFAQIRADNIPDGIIPKDKRQVAGTGVTSSSSTQPPSTSDMSSSATAQTSVPASSTPASSTPSSDSTTPSSPSTTPTSTPTSPPASSSPTSEPQSSSQQAPSTSTIPTSIEVTTTNSDGSTVTSRIRTSTAVAETSSGPFSTGTGKSSDLVAIGSSTINRSTLSEPTTITSAFTTSNTIPSSYTSYWTTDGTVRSSLVSTNKVVASTGTATATISPSLQDSKGSGSSLSDSSKKIIGGVVGGIGGAILIGGLALVAWRIWGKKKGQQLPQDDFMESTNDSIHKPTRLSDPASNGLDRYQNPPSMSVNTASNF